MRHIVSVTVVAALLIVTADVIAAGAKMGAGRIIHHTATGITVALPSGMKSFPVELPQ